MYISNCKG